MPDQSNCKTIIKQGDTLLMEYEGDLLGGLYTAAANHLTGSERLELIERLQAEHAVLEARFR